MRVCIVNEFFYPDDTGGTGMVLSDLARTLRTLYEDVEIDVLTSRHCYRGAQSSLASEEQWDGIRITRLAAPRAGGLPSLLRLGANLLFAGAALLTLLRRRQQGYDLVLVGTAPPTAPIAALAYRRLTGTPYLYTLYDLYPDCAAALGVLRADHPLSRALRHGQKMWLRGAARVIVLGRCMRDHVKRFYAVPADTLDVIPIGADPGEIIPAPKATEFRRQQEIGGFMVCYSGNFGRYQDFDTILDAAALLQSLRADVTFVLVGEGAQKRHIARRVEAEALSNVRLLPFVPRSEYADLLASADALLVTLEPGMEGLGVPSKFYSILAAGRPTLAIVSPRSEVSLVLNELDCGVQLPQGDADALVSAIRHLAAHPEEAERMGRAARRALVEHYSLSRAAERYYAAMRAAAGIEMRLAAQNDLVSPPF